MHYPGRLYLHCKCILRPTIMCSYMISSMHLIFNISGSKTLLQALELTLLTCFSGFFNFRWPSNFWGLVRYRATNGVHTYLTFTTYKELKSASCCSLYFLKEWEGTGKMFGLRTLSHLLATVSVEEDERANFGRTVGTREAFKGEFDQMFPLPPCVCVCVYVRTYVHMCQDWTELETF